MGFVAYRKSGKDKAIDMRIELKRTIVKTVLDSKKLHEQMQAGNESRRAIASAIGKFNSGMMDRWDKDLTLDQKEAEELINNLPDEDTSFEHLDTKGLEAELISSYKIQEEIQRISQKYSEALAWDNERRSQIKEVKRAEPEDIVS